MFLGKKKDPTQEAEANCKLFYYWPQTLEGGRKAGITEKNKCKKKLKNLKHNESSCLIHMQGEGQPQAVTYSKL